MTFRFRTFDADRRFPPYGILDLLVHNAGLACITIYQTAAPESHGFRASEQLSIET